ncbi:uncharacterized protein RCO7_14258 [Rhynchosporium graminicola]|uniref:Uncharacterized protein n=1 Tax=Rhynchosporium graminicola TaxID=2792576 RepID=A0A1E1K4C4_9HELO|nr:uncharacterized protein RCO7_14258 [Rhynchosporium commune]
MTCRFIIRSDYKYAGPDVSPAQFPEAITDRLDAIF